MRYATIGLGDPRVITIEAIAFLIFTAAAFGGAVYALRRQ